MKKILVIAPHPDDEVLGCGGTISKYAEGGNEVYLCIVTRAYPPDWSEEFIKNRSKEIEKANRILGIKKTYFLDYQTLKLDMVPQKDLSEKILKVIEETNPDFIFVPHRGDIRKDHQSVFDASLVAARPIGVKIKEILSYETLSESEWGNPAEPFVPNFYIDVSKTFGKKTEAMKAYSESELKEYPHPRSLEVLEALAKKRGSEAGLKLAEAFMLIRKIID